MPLSVAKRRGSGEIGDLGFPVGPVMGGLLGKENIKSYKAGESLSLSATSHYISTNQNDFFFINLSLLFCVCFHALSIYV